MSVSNTMLRGPRAPDRFPRKLNLVTETGLAPTRRDVKSSRTADGELDRAVA
jgi:hypothetical protein